MKIFKKFTQNANLDIRIPDSATKISVWHSFNTGINIEYLVEEEDLLYFNELLNQIRIQEEVIREQKKEIKNNTWIRKKDIPKIIRWLI